MKLSCYEGGVLRVFGVGDVVRVAKWISASTVFVVVDIIPPELGLERASARRGVERVQLQPEECRHVLNRELVEP